MNKTKKTMTGVALTLVCAALIMGSAFALMGAAARPMETAPVVTEIDASGIVAKDLNVVAVAAKSSESAGGTPVLVQDGIVTVSEQDNKTWKIGDEGLEFESGYEPVVFSEEDGIVTISGQGFVTWKASAEGGLGAVRVYEVPFIEGVPGEDDIAAETAIETATRAIKDKYALTEKTLARFTSEASFNVANPDEPVWTITFNPANNSDFSEIGCYTVTINAKTGEIVNITSAADGIG
jgi:hypothetical protein